MNTNEDEHIVLLHYLVRNRLGYDNDAKTSFSVSKVAALQANTTGLHNHQYKITIKGEETGAEIYFKTLSSMMNELTPRQRNETQTRSSSTIFIHSRNICSR